MTKLAYPKNIIWEGKPDFNYTKEEKSYWTAIPLIAFLIQKIYWFAILAGAIYLWWTGFIPSKDVIILPIGCFGYLTFLYLDEKFVLKRMQSYKFILTNKRVHYYSWHLWKGNRVNTIDLKDIQKISLEEFENEIGTIYFMGKNLGAFINEDLTSGETKHHPSLQLIKNAKDLVPVINKLLLSLKTHPYQPPELTP